MAERVLPKGYRWIEPSEILQEGDLCVCVDGSTFRTAAIGWSCKYKRLYIRPDPFPQALKEPVETTITFNWDNPNTFKEMQVKMLEDPHTPKSNPKVKVLRSKCFYTNAWTPEGQPNTGSKNPMPVAMFAAIAAPSTDRLQSGNCLYRVIDWKVVVGDHQAMPVLVRATLVAYVASDDNPSRLDRMYEVATPGYPKHKELLREAMQPPHDFVFVDPDNWREYEVVDWTPSLREGANIVVQATFRIWLVPDERRKEAPEQAQVRPEQARVRPEPGEGYRLLDPSEKVEQGDEAFDPSSPHWGWIPAYNWRCPVAKGSQSKALVYRRHEFAKQAPEQAPVSAPALPEPEPVKGEKPVKAESPTLSVGDWVRIRKHPDNQCFTSQMDGQDGLIGQVKAVGKNGDFDVRTKTGRWYYTPQCLTKLPDPGEGYRLLDPSEKVEEGDEYAFERHPETGWEEARNWKPRLGNGKQGKELVYRRKIAVTEAPAPVQATVSAPATPELQAYQIPSADDIGKRVVVIERRKGYESRSVGFLVKYVARIDRPDIVEVGVSATPADSFTNLYFLHKTDKNPMFQIVVLEDSKHE